MVMEPGLFFAGGGLVPSACDCPHQICGGQGRCFQPVLVGDVYNAGTARSRGATQRRHRQGAPATPGTCSRHQTGRLPPHQRLTFFTSVDAHG